MDCWPASADHSQTSTAAKIHLLVSCKTGAIHKITTGRGLQSCTVQLTERSSDFLQILTCLLNVFKSFLLPSEMHTKHFCALFPVSLQARTHQAPSNCHHISALPPEPGRNTEVTDKFKALYTKGTFIEPPISPFFLS